MIETNLSDSNEIDADTTHRASMHEEPVTGELIPHEHSFDDFSRQAAGDWWLLVICSIIIVASFLLGSRGEKAIVLPFIGGQLPELCFSRRFLQIDCPGCGLTRSFVNLAHGDVARSLHFNPAGVLMFSLIAFQIPFRILQIVRIKSGHKRIVIPHWEWIFYGIVAVMVTQWAIKLVS